MRAFRSTKLDLECRVLAVCVNGQWSNVCCSVCICPHSHRRLSLSILDYLPVSIFKKMGSKANSSKCYPIGLWYGGICVNRMTGQIRVKQKVIFPSGRVRLTDPSFCVLYVLFDRYVHVIQETLQVTSRRESGRLSGLNGPTNWTFTIVTI